MAERTKRVIVDAGGGRCPSWTWSGGGERLFGASGKVRPFLVPVGGLSKGAKVRVVARESVVEPLANTWDPSLVRR